MVTVIIIATIAGVIAIVAALGFYRARKAGRIPIEAPPTRPVTPPPRGPELEATDAPVVTEPATHEPVAPPAPIEPLEHPDVAEAQVEAEVEAAPEPIVKARLRDRLGRTRAALAGYVRGIANRTVDQSTWDDLEEALLLADVGLDTTQQLLDAVQARATEFKVTDPDEVVALLRTEIEALLEPPGVDRSLHAPDGKLNVWLFVGVNGVGKTTTIGKLAAQQIADGDGVVLAAADTFRAAAAEQLTQWAQRTGAEIVRGQEGGDPAAVVFDAMSAATSRDAHLLLVDTAGRLHTKQNLMSELEKLKRIVDRTPDALEEVLLVIDATTGQNGLQQAKQFAEAVDVTGIVLTKLDGTAKGGIVLAIQSELDVPVKLVGVGEQVGDLIDFDPREFAAALFED
jgi:fused signal recognition particle receptor